MAVNVVASPVSTRLTVAALLLLTFATGLVDAISVLVLGHVFVANMTGNIIFLGFWFVPHVGVNLIAAIIAFFGFLAGTVTGGRLARHFGTPTRRWLVAALGIEIIVLVALSILVGTGVLSYRSNGKFVVIVLLATIFGVQNATARQFGIADLSTTVLTTTVVGIGVESRLGGGAGKGGKVRYSAVFAMCGGAVVGATMSRFAVAPVFALAAGVVAASLVIFRFGPDRADEPS